MKKFARVLIFLTFILTAPVSCYKEEPEKEEFDAPLVIEGWIESGRTPVVMVTSGIEISENKRKIEDLRANILRYADVSIEHNGVSYKLSARYSDEYTLQNYFTTGELRGVVGDEYKLTVKWKDKTATAVARIPEPHPMEKLTAKHASDEYDSDYIITTHIVDDHSCERFYKFFVRDTVVFPGYRPALLSTISNRNRPDEFDFAIENSVDYFKHKNTRLFKEGRTIGVKMATMEEEIFDFFSTVDQNSMCIVLPFVTYISNVKGNIDGALGYWAGYGIDEKEVICVE